VLLGTCVVVAAPAEEGPTISGFVNVTYNTNFNNPDSETTGLRSYDAATSTFIMNAAHLEVKGSPSEALGYVVELDVGSDAAVTSGDDDFDFQEAYITYKFGDSGCSLKAGKFATYMGIEVIESPDNPVISRGFLYGLAESFTHTGIVFEHAFSEKFDVALGAVNGWDVAVDSDGEQTFLAKVGMTPSERFGLSISVLSGPDGTAGSDLTSYDVTGACSLGEKTTLNFQYNTGSDDAGEWNGFALEPVFRLTDTVSLGVRFEQFTDEDDVRTGLASPAGEGKYTNITVAPAFAISEALTLRAEVRLDSADWDAFEDEGGGVTDGQTTLALELIAKF
jgi:hypothetical protein